MKDHDDATSAWMDKLPAPRKSWRRWLVIAGLASAFALMLGVGALLGSAFSATQAASANSASNAQFLAGGAGNGSDQSFVVVSNSANNAQTFAAGPGAQGQCESLTVSSVSGSTIVAKAANGSTVTIHTTANTQYTQAGKAAVASAIKAGTHISVMGTHNSDGSITATRIDIVG